MAEIPHSATAAATPPAPADARDGRNAGSLDRRRLFDRLRATRAGTEMLVAPLGPEDQNLQSKPEVSPAKWHRAHTSWFFETFVLGEFLPGYEPFHPAFAELFNSYYNGVGRQHPRPRRSLLSRPDAETVTRYRAHVDDALEALFETAADERFDRFAGLVELGIAHEQQHQELILTDLKHAFSFNPLAPALGQGPDDRQGGMKTGMAAPDWFGFDGGQVQIGARADDGFCFDNETPRHTVYLNQPFELAGRPVTCGEYAEFVDDGGYREPMLWLSDGWAWVQENGIDAPLYWHGDREDRQIYTLAGRRPPAPAEPVVHLNFYEAAAFAEWAGARLPTEAEWEAAAAAQPLHGQFADSGRYHPAPVASPAGGDDGPAAMFGTVWEWTASAYGPYPGFRPAPGAVGEYNGKFMANQMVLRGGSCATPAGHIRAGYRNFFYPPDRWQFTGLRLARDA
ncbi:MAG: ergothioneine biosynthesis protein EgtB [Wenzhouxiangellaceae bacterium]|nr:ergothioneine biosynthesis protein EgtB [Wenzhouxiangellaceae bacterium]